MVEEHKFKQLMQVTNPDFKNLSRHTVKRDLLASFKNEKEIFKSLLSSAMGKVCLTSDNWRSEHTLDEFIYITAHWIDVNWKLQKIIIWFKDLTHPFDSKSIADEVSLCLRDWGIEDKVFSITLDNAAYNDQMAKNLKRRLLINGSLLCGGDLFQVRCCSHILNLIVQSGLKLADDVISKVRNGIKYLKKSVSRKKKFYDIAVKTYHLNENKRLRIDVSVRWNSTFLMLDHAIYFKSALQYWGCRDNNYKNYVLSEDEWEKVEKLHQFLEVFYDVTCAFSGSKYPTSNVYFRGVWKIHKHLLSEIRAPSSFISGMVGKMKEKFDKYWTDYSLVLSCAAVLDPRLKLRYLEFAHEKTYGNTSRLAPVVDTLNSIYDEYELRHSSLAQSGGSANIDSSGRQQDSDEEYDIYLSHRSSQSEKTQLALYLNEASLDIRADIDILEHWKKVSDQFPILASMARDILAIPISTVASESTFSIGKKLISPWRSSLKSNTIEALICLEDWIRVADGNLIQFSLFFYHINIK